MQSLYLRYFYIFDILKVQQKKGAFNLNQYFTNNPNLKSERRVINFQYGSVSYEFLSDNGVFSKNKIDYGSISLINAYLKEKHNIKSFLDVGCGYGFISVVLAKILGISGVGCDINKRALHLATENAELNKVSVSFIESDIYENIEGSFDLVITNPPIRAGKKVVLEILEGASLHLNQNGEVWAVIRKDQGAKSIMKELEKTYTVELKEKNKGFFIFMLKKN